MKKSFSLAIFLWVILLSLTSISVVVSPNIQINVLSTRVNAASSKPTVEIIYPTQGDFLHFGTHRIEVLASDPSGIATVKLKIDGPESTNGWVEITANKIGSHYYYDWTVGTEGDYSITARVANGVGRQASDTVGVTVTATPPAPDFTLDASPNTLTIVLGGSDTSTITVTSLNSFSSPVDLTVAGQPENVIATLTPTQVTPPADGSVTSTLTVTVGDSATPGTYTLTVTGTSGSLVHTCAVTLTLATEPHFDYVLSIEIDYMPGHKPTQSVLNYIQEYYSERSISVTFYIDDRVPLDRSVSYADFAAFEAQYNDNDNGYYSEWKWVLFGTTVSGAPNVVGYTYVIIQDGDLLAGNYIFIADTTADRWASQNGLEEYGAEAVVLMHEMGHSIGIAKLDSNEREIYDPDPYSVMSYLSTANAGFYWLWYYSDDYWATRNMNYYT